MQLLVTLGVLVYAAGGPGGPGASTVRDRAVAALEQAARVRGATVVEAPLVALREVRAAGWVDRAALDFFGRAGKLVASGREALARVELARAEGELAAAERLYAGELWRPHVAPEAALAALWHGVALFELGRREEAERAWRRAVTLERTTVLTEAMVRPDAARAFAQALKPRPTALLEVTARRGGLPVAFAVDGETHEHAGANDGNEVEGQGTQPLPVGEHVVSADGVSRWVELPATGAKVTLEVPVDTVAAAVARLGQVPDAEGLETLRATLALDGVLVAAVGEGEAPGYAAALVRAGCVTATLSDTRPDLLVQRLLEAPCRPGRRELATTLVPPAPAATTSAGRPVERRPRPARAPVWRRPWVWMAGVGALAVGVVVGATLWPRTPSYTATLDFHQFSLRF